MSRGWGEAGSQLEEQDPAGGEQQVRGPYLEARFAGMFLEELQAQCGQRRVSKGEGGGRKMRPAGGQGGTPGPRRPRGHLG